MRSQTHTILKYLEPDSADANKLVGELGSREKPTKHALKTHGRNQPNMPLKTTATFSGRLLGDNRTSTIISAGAVKPEENIFTIRCIVKCMTSGPVAKTWLHCARAVLEKRTIKPFHF